MKILFTADIHIKLGQKNVPVQWAKGRYELFLQKLEEISSGADVLVIGGDTFDRMPSIEELEIFFQLVKRSTIPTYIYDGNHESTKKGSTFLSSIKNVCSFVNPLVRIVDDVEEFEWGTIVPYCKLKTFKGINKDKPVFTHVRGDIPPHVKAEVDLSIFEEFPVVFAGDLHSHSNTQLNIIYPGSPMTTSFHREKVKTGYLEIDSDTLVWDWIEIKLPQLLRKTITDPSQMLETDYDHTIYEIEGDLSKLADVKNHDLLDKKIVKRSTEATLLLDASMTMEEELYEYLLYILELPEESATNIIGTYRDYAQKT